MMDYKALFDRGVDRAKGDSYKWDASMPDNVLPLWVADMDFATAPPVIDALQKRVANGAFGYVRVPDAYYDAVTSWFHGRHGWDIAPNHIIYTSGVVPALSAVIKALTVPGDKVIVQTPVYNCFFSSIRNNGCEALENRLIFTGDSYRMDFDGLRECCADPRAKLLLLCNPANPAGRVWTREELMTLAEICHGSGVTVVSDEIHCELVYDRPYTPFATLPEELTARSVSCVSPSKAFNTAGLQIANIVVPDAEMRRRIDKAININEVCDVNPFGVAATIAAYKEGGEWLDALVAYLYGNYKMMSDFCAERFPELPICRLEGTYLVWMDCRALGMDSVALEEKLLSDTGLWLNAGSMYGEAGEGFMRWNIACPRGRLAEALERFSGFVSRYRQNPR